MKLQVILPIIIATRMYAASCTTAGIYPTALTMTVGTIGSNQTAEQTIGIYCNSNFNDTIASITASVTTGIGTGNLTVSASNTSTSASPVRPYVMLTVALTSPGLSVGSYSGAITIVHTGEPNTVIPVSATVVSGLPIKAVLDDFTGIRPPIGPTVDVSTWKVFNGSCGSGSPEPACDAAKQNIGPPPYNFGFGMVGATQYSGPYPPVRNTYYPTYPTQGIAEHDIDMTSIFFTDGQLTTKMRSQGPNANYYTGWRPSRVYPAAAMQNYLKGGTWDANFNRLQFEFSCVSGFTFSVSSLSQTGTYVKWNGTYDTSLIGQHYYWSGNPNIYGGQPLVYTLTATPAHIVGEQNGFNHPNDTTWVNPRYYTEPTTGQTAPTHIFDGMNEWYFSPLRNNRFSDQTCVMKNVYLWKQDAEPDEYVETTTLEYTGTGYEVGFKSITQAPTYPTDNTTYEVRYSSSGSLKIGGFSSGTLATNTLTNGADDGWQNYNFASGAQSQNLWVGIRPHAAVWAATNTSPIIVSGLSGLGLQTGDQVTVSGVNCNGSVGSCAANNTWTVTVKPWQIYSYTYTNLVSVTQTPDTSHITVTTSTPHGLVVGQVIETMYGSGDFGYPLTFTVSSIGSSTVFTALSPQGPLSGSPNTDTDLTLYVVPSLSLNGSTGNGTYTSGGFIVATSNTSNFSEMYLAKNSLVGSFQSSYSNIALPSGASFR